MENIFTIYRFKSKNKTNRRMPNFIRLLFSFVFLYTVVSYSQTATAPSGSGTSGSPYLVASLNNLYWISQNDSTWSAGHYFKQTADIEASSTSGWSGGGWSPIGDSAINFAGNYDGGGFAIDSLYISRAGTNYQGMFGYSKNATVQNLGVTSININGPSDIGGLVGYAYGSTITKCYSTGSVNGTVSAIGGLVGYSNQGTNISQSFSNCNVTSTATSEDWVGGLIGVSNNNGVLTDCYSTGNVIGYNRVGSLVGYYVNGGSATRCYSIGKAKQNGTSSITGLIGTGPGSQCFLDKETSGYTTSTTEVMATTTALMKTQTTFTDSSWDFTSTWAMSASKNGGYPYLQWQTFPNSITITDGSSYTPSPAAGGTNQPIGTFALLSNAFGSTLDGVWIQLNGTRTGASNFKLWESSNNTFDSGIDTQIGSTISTDPGDGNYIWFISLSRPLITSDKYYFLTCDLASNATGSVQPLIVTNNDLMFGFSTLGSTINNLQLNSGASPLPVELTTFTANNLGDKEELYWHTATEMNNFGFEIQRSEVSGQNLNPPLNPLQGGETATWQKIGFVKGSGNSNSPKSYSFIDKNPPSGIVEYRLKQIDNDGGYKYSQILTENILPTKFELFQNYPNPFNPITIIQYSVPIASYVTIKLYDELGKEVKTLVDKNKTAGKYRIYFADSKLASGVYFYRIKAGSFSDVKKLVLLK